MSADRCVRRQRCERVLLLSNCIVAAAKLQNHALAIRSVTRNTSLAIEQCTLRHHVKIGYCGMRYRSCRAYLHPPAQHTSEYSNAFIQVVLSLSYVISLLHCCCSRCCCCCCWACCALCFAATTAAAAVVSTASCSSCCCSGGGLQEGVSKLLLYRCAYRLMTVLHNAI
jgi:hypothetical protein